MKFSWKLINNFINLTNISIDKLTEYLTLSGIETEEVKYVKTIKDNILDLSLTTNRKEIYSALSLAEEISIVLNIPLKILPIYFFEKTTNKQTIKNNHNHVTYVSINKLHNMNIQQNKSKWLNDYLAIHNIKNNDVISNIQKYIEIKWGVTFNIIDENQLININKILNTNINLSDTDLINLKSNKNKANFLVFISNQNMNKMRINNYKNYYWNSYIDTKKLISTVTGCIHGKSYKQYKIEQISYKYIEINKKEIDTILGKTKHQELKYLLKDDIISVLKQLTLFKTYNKFLQRFTVNIPENRRHDLQRKIDIIEEIGRIKGFYNFFDKVPGYTQKQGHISHLSIKVKKIRKILRHLGFNEVINTSLVDNQYKHHINIIQLHNPIIKEQHELRNNIIQTLIKNCQHHIKQNNKNLQIFEIGKIFQKQNENIYIENITLGGLIHNTQFIRSNWSEIPKYANFFHIKGIIKTILEELNANIILDKIYTNQNTQFINNIKTIIHPIKRIGIYDKYNQELLGIIGEIHPLYSKELSLKKYKIYMFEINIEKLNNTIQMNNHLSYLSKQYSNYPSVTRDISIKIRKNIEIKQIKKLLSKKYNPLIETVKISNEYFNHQNRYKAITISITYRAENRTLNKYDIQTIDEHINYILSRFESKT